MIQWTKKDYLRIMRRSPDKRDYLRVMRSQPDKRDYLRVMRSDPDVPYIPYDDSEDGSNILNAYNEEAVAGIDGPPNWW